MIDTRPRTGLILAERQTPDPRLVMGEGALILANRNAYPVVARAGPAKRDNGLVVGGLAALLLGGATFWGLSAHRTPAAPPPVPAAPLILPRSPQVAVPVRPMPITPPSLLMPHVGPSFATPTPAITTQAPLVTYDQSQPLSSPTTAAGPADIGARPGTHPQPLATGAGGTDNDQFAARLGSGGGVEVATAQRLSDPATTITQGTLIPAVLETAIDTDLPGYVRALVAQDVRSFDGSRVLVPRSSRLIGQYKSGLAAGQTRAYVIWTRLIRPDGVSVALASPAIDFAGRSGLDGKVDSHFLKRFGSAALLSVVGGLSAIGNASVVLSGGQSAASVAAQHDASIPPTIKVPQGQPIRVFTARDLDFGGVSDGGAGAAGAP